MALPTRSCSSKAATAGHSLATDAKADPAAQNVPGDLRVLVTRQNGPSTSSGQAKPLAVIYRPKVKGFTGQPDRLSYRERRVLRRHRDQRADRLTYQKLRNGAFQAEVTLPARQCSVGSCDPAAR